MVWKVFHPMRFIKPATVLFLAALATASSPGRRPKIFPSTVRAVVLFDGKDLSQFDTFLPSAGLNADPNHVFTVENGIVHVSGTEMGYFITKQEYKNYYLRAEFKWGEGTFGAREGQARDSGILYNIQGPNKVWPRSVEFQINEGCTGDFWMTDGAALTGKDGVRVTGPAGSAMKIDRFNKGVFKNVTGYPRPHQRVGKTARRVERRRTGEPRRPRLAVRQRQAGQRGHGRLSNQRQDSLPVRRRRSLLPQHQAVPAEIRFARGGKRKG